MAGTFVKLMKKWSEKIKPKRILEWGMGHSTGFLREFNPDAQIITIDHTRDYFEWWTQKLKGFNIECHLLGQEDMKEYTNPPVKGKFDLIFVDGEMGHRIKCMKFAKTVLSDGGVLILHDTQRGVLKEAFDILNEVESDTEFVEAAGWDVTTTVFKK